MKRWRSAARSSITTIAIRRRTGWREYPSEGKSERVASGKRKRRRPSTPQRDGRRSLFQPASIELPIPTIKPPGNPAIAPACATSRPWRRRSLVSPRCGSRSVQSTTTVQLESGCIRNSNFFGRPILKREIDCIGTKVVQCRPPAPAGQAWEPGSHSGRIRTEGDGLGRHDSHPEESLRYRVEPPSDHDALSDGPRRGAGEPLDEPGL